MAKAIYDAINDQTKFRGNWCEAAQEPFAPFQAYLREARFYRKPR